MTDTRQRPGKARSHRLRVRVCYPVGRGHLLLRGEADWQRDVPPVAHDAPSGCWDFELESSRPYHYFKPIIRDRAGRVWWSIGPNGLALANDRGTLEIHPYFFGWRDDLAERIAAEPKRALRIYLDSGWPKDNYEANRGMAAALRTAGYEPGRELEYRAFPNAAHDEHHWAMRVHLPVQFLFGVEGGLLHGQSKLVDGRGGWK